MTPDSQPETTIVKPFSGHDIGLVVTTYLQIQRLKYELEGTDESTGEKNPQVACSCPH